MARSLSKSNSEITGLVFLWSCWRYWWVVACWITWLHVWAVLCWIVVGIHTFCSRGDFFFVRIVCDNLFERRINVKFLVKLEIYLTDIPNMSQKVYGMRSVSRTQKLCCKVFCSLIIDLDRKESCAEIVL